MADNVATGNPAMVVYIDKDGLHELIDASQDAGYIAGLYRRWYEVLGARAHCVSLAQWDRIRHRGTGHDEPTN